MRSAVSRQWKSKQGRGVGAKTGREMEAQVASSSSSPGDVKLKIAGAWAGVLDVDLQAWTLPMLRQEIAQRSNCAPQRINLIFAGKILRDCDGQHQTLSQLGLKPNAKILASRVSADEGKIIHDEAERSNRLSRLRAAALALSKRHVDGSLPVEDFNLELEDQSGQKIQLGSETDQQGVMMGLMLHVNAKQLIKKEKYKDALEVLVMGEEAFSLCDPKVIEMVDNVAILQLDIVWCYFMLRDISCLSMAGVRLRKARKGLERAHGQDATRVRLLQAGRHVELAIYLRLELLEGVVAYHSGLFEQSQKTLSSAQAKYLQLQVSDEALSLLLSMGYKEKAAKRALRMTDQDVESAVELLIEEKERRSRRIEEDLKRRKEIVEQKSYGMTPLKKAVNLLILDELVTLGFEKPLAAEALRRNENDIQKALDVLTNPDTNSALQLFLHSKSRKKPKISLDVAIEELVSMGFEQSQVVRAVRASKTKEQALNFLLSDQIPNPEATNSASVQNDGEDAVESFAVAEVEEEGPSCVKNEEKERDVEMEDQIAQELSGDPLSDYDIDIVKEGEAITEYLALLASTS